MWRRPLPQVLRDELMDPIGASTTWRWYGYENSWVVIDGERMQSVSGGGHYGGGMFINAWDMGRFGYLFLRRGRWAGRQVMSEKWIDLATTPGRPIPRTASQTGTSTGTPGPPRHGALPRGPAAAQRAAIERFLPRQRGEHHLHRLGQRPGRGHPVASGGQLGPERIHRQGPRLPSGRVAALRFRTPGCGAPRILAGLSPRAI